MNLSLRTVGSTLLAAIVIGGSTIISPAHAASGPALNGRYAATSLGNWAKTNDSYHDEATVRSIWTITSSCTTAQDCNGQVASDQGWAAPLVMHDGTIWKVTHDVPNWETCADGTSVPGHQIFTFYSVDDTGLPQPGTSTYAGRDKTVGPSGACGTNKWLAIEMPFRLDKIG